MHIATFLLLKFGSRKGKCKVELFPSPLSATEVWSAIRYTSKPPDSSSEFGICVSILLQQCVFAVVRVSIQISCIPMPLPSSSVHKLRRQETGNQES
jgi:hypothetical protein